MARERLNPQEAASYIGCSYGYIMIMVRGSGVPHFKIGRRTYFFKDSLDEWMSSKEHKLNTKHPNLIKLIQENGILLRKMSLFLHLRHNDFVNKLYGNLEFTTEEKVMIKKIWFKEYDISYLFNGG